MKAIVLFLLLSITFVECKKDDDPGKDVNQAWLDATIADLEKSEIKQYFYIVKADYEGTCVTYVNNCCPMCLTAIILYRCDDGAKLENTDATKIKNATTIWTPEDFSCATN